MALETVSYTGSDDTGARGRYCDVSCRDCGINRTYDGVKARCAACKGAGAFDVQGTPLCETCIPKRVEHPCEGPERMGFRSGTGRPWRYNPGAPTVTTATPATPGRPRAKRRLACTDCGGVVFRPVRGGGSECVRCAPRSNPSGDMDDTLDQLVQMAAESSEFPEHRNAHATDEVRGAWSAFSAAANAVLPEEAVDDEGDYLTFMTLEGHGVGIGDKPWGEGAQGKALRKRIKEDPDLQDAYRALVAEIDNAAYETGGGEYHQHEPSERELQGQDVRGAMRGAGAWVPYDKTELVDAVKGALRRAGAKVNPGRKGRR